MTGVNLAERVHANDGPKAFVRCRAECFFFLMSCIASGCIVANRNAYFLQKILISVTNLVDYTVTHMGQLYIQTP